MAERSRFFGAIANAAAAIRDGNDFAYVSADLPVLIFFSAPGVGVMKVRDLMTTEVKACSRNDTLNRAAQIMWENDCGAVPVVDDDFRPVGMITDRDICMAAYTQGVLLSESSVERAMASGAYTCDATDEVSAAEKLMREQQVRRLPVVDGGGRIVGIISLGDVARQADRERASKSKKRQVKDTEIVETLGAISNPNGRGGAAHAA